MKFYQFLSRIKASHWVIILFLLVIPPVNFNHHAYSSKEGIISWDVKSYYAYLPAAIIYHDLSLDFMKKDMGKFGQWIWPSTTPTGKKAILTTYGLSVLYLPFFLIAHTYASASPKYLADGYSFPYHVALQFSVYVYFIIALFVLRKILLRYFDEKVTAITLLAVGTGTNLFYYITYNAAMSHGFNFFLIVLFIYYLEKWTDKISIKNTLALGLLGGLIALIRPTNIAILLLIPLWRVGSWSDFKEKIGILFNNWYWVVLMAFVFLLVWIPQFVYWKYVSGQFFYFSYGERGDRFFFTNPQIWKVLFSYEKGWFVYTPMMFLAVIGIFALYKKKIKLALPVLVYVMVMVYILSSWWCWWYGGSFGQRSMVDFYGVMALPLAAIIDSGLHKKWLNYASLLLVGWLIFFNQFNLLQYRHMAISYWWMGKEGYWENFMKSYPTCKYWNIAIQPRYEVARSGIYEYEAPFSRAQIVTDAMLEERIIKENQNKPGLIDSLQSVYQLRDSAPGIILDVFAKQLIAEKKAEPYFRLIKLDYYQNQIRSCKSWKNEMEHKAKKKHIAFDEMVAIEADRVYNLYSQKYDQR